MRCCKICISVFGSLRFTYVSQLKMEAVLVNKSHKDLDLLTTFHCGMRFEQPGEAEHHQV